jgi:hypothetical protein
MTISDEELDAAKTAVYSTFFALAAGPDDRAAGDSADQALARLDALLAGERP